MIEQNLKPQMGQKKKKIMIIAVVVLLALTAVLLFIASRLKYSPPAFEKNAKAGEPEVSEDFLYEEIDSDYGYKIGIAANLYQQEDQSCKVFFTNPESNNTYLKCQICSGDDVLYESGIIKPGEYVESLEAAGKFDNVRMDVTVNIYAFNPEDWTSDGKTQLNLVLQPW